MKPRTVSAVCCALLLLPLLHACATPPAGDAPATNGADGAGDVQVYEVRGQVTALPDPSDPLSNLRLRHEAVADFVGMDGEVVGMESMNMPFPVAEGLSLEGLEVGDPVTFTLEVDWDGDPAYRVTRIERLPEGTELDWGAARPPSGTGSATEDSPQD